MTTPRVDIDIAKIAHNARELKKFYGSKGIEVIGVTKAVCGDSHIVDTLLKSGINKLADSRISNIRHMRDASIEAQFILLRTPIPSQIDDVVKYTDTSLNTEISVIRELSKAAVQQNRLHNIILMVELGDLREGLMPADIEKTVQEIMQLKGIKLSGIGTNLTCFGGIKPDDKNMGNLSSIVRDIEKKFGLTLEFVSGGNSANYSWFISTKDVGMINNLRLGESIFLGRETLYRKHIPCLFTDAFTLVTEVIESKIKPSIPYGEVCQDAFGNVPKFEDQGQIRRAILGIGAQDVLVSGLTPKLEIEIIGKSSDHIIVNAKQLDLRVGNEVDFDLNYGALLSVMTSPYVLKQYVNDQ